MTRHHVTLSPSLTCRRTRTVDITDGARVLVARWDGRRTSAKIDGEPDEKDGRTVVSLSDGTWAYTDQIESGSPAKPGSTEISHYSHNAWDADAYDAADWS